MSENAETPVCSSRGCRRTAEWMLQWRNPRLHSADRVKRWAACEEHLETLRTFLTSRDFPCETVRLNDEKPSDEAG